MKEPVECPLSLKSKKNGAVYNYIKLFGPNDSLEELTNLIHRAFRELADQGFKYWATHQTINDTKKRIAKGACYIKTINGKIISTIVLNKPNNSDGHPWYERSNVTTFHQFAVDPDFQKQGIGTEMMDFVEQRAIEFGVDELSCDTAEGASHLIKMYRKRGYRIIGKANWDITNYISVIMSKKLV